MKRIYSCWIALFVTFLICTSSATASNGSPHDVPTDFTEDMVHGEWLVFVTSTGPFATSKTIDGDLKSPSGEDVVLHIAGDGDNITMTEPESGTTEHVKRYQPAQNIVIYGTKDNSDDFGVVLGALGVGVTPSDSSEDTWYWYLTDAKRMLFTQNGQVMVKGQSAQKQYMLRNNTIYDIKENGEYSSYPVIILGGDSFLVSVEALKGMLNVHAFYVRFSALQGLGW